MTAEAISMLTLTEIEKAVDGLTVEQKRELLRYLEESLHPPSASLPTRRTHRVADIPAVELGKIFPLPQAENDLLGEMVEGRR